MAEQRKTIICICCPLGCEIIAEKREVGFKVENNKCTKGWDYAFSELTNPVRHVTSTITLGGGPGKLLPVRTSLPVPKDKMFAVVSEIKRLKVKNPVSAGQVLIKNVAGTDADIIASDHSCTKIY
jgi:CxxC motif-containing protein